MPPLAQLRDVAAYRPCDWDLKVDAEGRTYWTGLFRWHLDEMVLPLLRKVYPDAPAADLERFKAGFLQALADVDQRPETLPRIDILYLTEIRNAVGFPLGFHDAFLHIKQEENAAALKLLPEVLAELDAAAPAQREELLAHGLMAGNVFDLGAKATILEYRDGNAAFAAVRGRFPRPWLHDDTDRWFARWHAAPYRHVAFFVDNAGGDVVLGCLPLARWMVQHGACVSLVANTLPALNDITAAELVELVQAVARFDTPVAEAWSKGALRVVASGNATPLIDLANLTDACVTALADADLIMLHGMGRSVESNWLATFGCDALHTAVVKEEVVAARIGGKLFDCVFRYRPA